MTEVTCPTCDGAGQIVEPVMDENGVDIIWKAFTCFTCVGHGKVEV